MGADPGALNRLAALCEGRWGTWRGLDPLPGADEIADQLGAPLDDAPLGGVFGGSPTVFRRYARNGDVSPVVVWFEGDLAVAVQVEHACRSVLDTPLADADDVLDSAFGDSWEQHVFGDRGLVLHVPTAELPRRPYAALVLGLPPFEVADFRSDPVRLIGDDRRRAR